jgi:acetolactate synthase-1/2/3 large subunit
MKIKVSDYIIKLLEEKGIDTAFCITGGAAAHLMESLRTSKIKVTHNYNEQACAMAADGYARIAKKPALVLVTNGPGSTNTITGVLGAWQDSLPMFILSGQVPRNQTLNSAKFVQLRQVGLQECDIIAMVKNCTNYATQLSIKGQIKFEVDRAWEMMTSGRMGPVWLDVPIDLQSEMIETDEQDPLFLQPQENKSNLPFEISEEILLAIRNAKQPVILAGNGIHLGNAETEFKELINQLNIPILCTWNATDLLPYEHRLYVGNIGLLGERAANFAVQQADLLLVLGSRLSIPCIGYLSNEFAPNAIKIMVDIDENEMNKPTVNIDFKINEDVKRVIPALMKQLGSLSPKTEWVEKITGWKWRFQAINEPQHTRDENHINSFDFIAELGKCLKPNSVVVTDMGTAFTCTMQTLRSNGGNRLFTSSALCSMGFGLPGAIGAYRANELNQVICVAGDGGLQMNIQELQTVVQYQLPIKIIVFNNGGYLAVSLMQDNLFDGKHFGSTNATGVGSPNFCAIARAYGIPAIKLKTTSNIKELANLLDMDGPLLIEVNMVRDQLLIPRVMSQKDASGKISSVAIDSMFPFLSPEIINEIKGT